MRNIYFFDTDTELCRGWISFTDSMYSVHIKSLNGQPNCMLAANKQHIHYCVPTADPMYFKVQNASSMRASNLSTFVHIRSKLQSWKFQIEVA